MRHVLAVSLLAATVLTTANAVAATPAVAATSGSASVARSVRISTGLIAPEVLKSVQVIVPESQIAKYANTPIKYVVQLHVDELGRAKDVKVVESATTELDADVVAAVKQFVFRPAQLDNTNVAAEVNLTVYVKR